MTRNIKKGKVDTSRNIDSHNHVTGRSIYVDDLPELQGTLYLAVFGSPVAHGHLKSIDLSAAEKVPGVFRIFTAKDIPGDNQIGGIIPDEPLLADQEVHFHGMPIALVAAESEAIAMEAAHLITAEIDPLPVIIDPREAFAKGQISGSPRTFQLGDSKKAFETCAHIFEGKAESGGQEHLYIETQGAYAIPMENGSLRVASSTQGPTAVQRTISGVLGIPMHKIEVDVTRLGGGFGGKEDQASAWGAMVAVVAHLTNKPAKFVLHRMDDMKMTGKRNPYSSDYKIGLDKDYKIIAYEATFYQNSGAAADLSPAILERTLFHLNNSYFIPNVLATAYSCRTNLPPNTAFRGFGGPQGMFVIEAAIHKAANALGIDPIVIQEANLLKDGDVFPYGQIAKEAEAINCWEESKERFNLQKIRNDVAEFNANNDVLKKGVALMPICFGISFTNTMMNNARALVHVYSDGSIGVSTGAVEMGQGVNTKMLQVATHYFAVSPDRIKIESTNTTRVANTSPTAASSTADLNGKALAHACTQILDRLKEVAASSLDTSADKITLKNETVYVAGKASNLHWEQLILTAFQQRVNLSAKGHYSTPTIHFDKTTEKGHPFAYHVYGTAIFVTTVDCIRGTYTFDSVKIVHDFGASMNRMIDLGQTEGGLVQGIGWMTMEEIIYDETGRLRSNALSTYKVPDIYAVPEEIDVHFLKTDGSDMAIFKSKAVGEPPLLYGIGAYFAVVNAMRAFNPNWMPEFYDAPITPEKVLMGLYAVPE